MDSKHLVEILADMRISLSEIRKDLNYHIKRTDILENTVVKDLPPLKVHVDRVNFLLSTVLYLASISGIVWIGSIIKHYVEKT